MDALMGETGGWALLTVLALPSAAILIGRTLRAHRVDDPRRSLPRGGLLLFLSAYLVYCVDVASDPTGPAWVSLRATASGRAPRASRPDAVAAAARGWLDTLRAAATTDLALRVVEVIVVVALVGIVLRDLLRLSIRRVPVSIPDGAIPGAIASWRLIEDFPSERGLPGRVLWVARPAATPVRARGGRVSAARVAPWVAGLAMSVAIPLLTIQAATMAEVRLLGVAPARVMAALPGALAASVVLAPLATLALGLLRPRDRRVGGGALVLRGRRHVYLLMARRHPSRHPLMLALEALLAPLAAVPPLPPPWVEPRYPDRLPWLLAVPPPAGWPPERPRYARYRELAGGDARYREALRAYRYACARWAAALRAGILVADDLTRPPTGAYLAEGRSSVAERRLVEAVARAGLPAEAGVAVPTGHPHPDPVFANYWPDIAVRDAATALLVDVEADGPSHANALTADSDHRRDRVFTDRGWSVWRARLADAGRDDWPALVAAALAPRYAEHRLAYRVAAWAEGLPDAPTLVAETGAEPDGPDAPDVVDLAARRRAKGE